MMQQGNAFSCDARMRESSMAPGQKILRRCGVTLGHKRRVGWLVFMLALVGARDAAAQRINSPYRFVETTQAVGGLGGYIAAGKGALGIGPQDAPIVGGRYGIRISGPFVIEAEAGFMSTTRIVLDTVPDDTTFTALGEADISLALARGALRFNLTGPRTYYGIQPFVLFGAGVAIEVADDAPVEEDLPPDMRFNFGTAFMGEAGGGLEIFAGNRISFRLDVRSLLWKLKTPRPMVLGDRALSVPLDEWTQNLFITGGLSIRF
jgi:hypothetical protein